MRNAVRIFTVSLGCPKNQVDTEVILGGFGSLFQNASAPEEAEVVLVNTCGFLQPAVEESLGVILDMAERIASLCPKPLLVVTGCLFGRYGLDLQEELPEVDLFVPLQEQSAMAQNICAHLDRRYKATRTRLLTSAPGFAYLKIAEGCDNTCRFCIIPRLRGGLISRRAEDILEDARACLATGRQELVVVAQDVTAYGRDRQEADALPRLLDALGTLPDLAWLRLLYLYPSGLTESLLRFLSSMGRPFLPYFDIPLQHAHPEILSSMGRPFRNDPRRIVDRVRNFFPEAALRTTFIVGYPGETEAHFKALESFVRETRFQHLGVFPFFAEEGTAAATLPGQIPEELKTERVDRIMSLQAEISEDVLAEYEGEEMEVLVDRPHDEWPGLHEGRVWFQAPAIDGLTYVSGENVYPGSLVQARIDETKTYDFVALA